MGFVQIVIFWVSVSTTVNTPLSINLRILHGDKKKQYWEKNEKHLKMDYLFFVSSLINTVVNDL